MFLPRPLNLDWLDAHCQSRFRVDPEPYRMRDEWHFDDLVGNGGSHILFVNGLNDGWSPMSYTEDLSDTIVAINIPSGAHHSELNHVYNYQSCDYYQDKDKRHPKHPRPGQECDDVRQAQEDIPVVLQGWVDEVKQMSQLIEP